MRKVILHYHLFKNAGTSVDAAFKKAFGTDKCSEKEFPNQRGLNHKGVREWIESSPNITYFSSHTALLPPPNIKGVEIFPILFIRHPLDRIVSAYTFEKKAKHSNLGGILANNTSLSGYIEVRLAINNDRSIRDFQTFRLSHMFASQEGSELEHASKAIENLPFIGLVDSFDASISELEDLLQKFGFDDLSLAPQHANISQSENTTIDKRLENFRECLGEGLWQRISSANENDFIIYDMVKNLPRGDV